MLNVKLYPGAKSFFGYISHSFHPLNTQIITTECHGSI